MGERPRLLTPEQAVIALRLYDVGHPWSQWPSVTGVPAERVLRSFRRAEPPTRLLIEDPEYVPHDASAADPVDVDNEPFEELEDVDEEPSSTARLVAAALLKMERGR